jgi:hypothetical protein
MASRAVVLAFAQRHGAKQAAERFGVPAGTIRSWRSRERRRAARVQADRERAGVPAPAVAQDEDEARRLLAWALAGTCLRCGGGGLVRVPEVRRGSLLIRRARTIECPDCGGPIRHLEVVEHDRDAWREGQRVAGDLGLGWSPDEWRLIRAGEPNPDGQRITGKPDAS